MTVDSSSMTSTLRSRARASDARAKAVLGELFPGREIVGIPSRDLVVGLGAVHCLTQQQPSVAGVREA